MKPETMVDVLVDIHLLEASQMNTGSNQSRINNTVVGYDIIFSKHGITAQEFDESFLYYRDHPKEMDELYQLVIDELTQMESEISPQAVKERMQRGAVDPGVPDTPRRRLREQSEW